MGCYDTIVIECPHCGNLYYAQSKSGDCLLETYFFPYVQKDVLLDINRHTPFVCEKCGTIFYYNFKNGNIEQTTVS